MSIATDTTYTAYHDPNRDRPWPEKLSFAAAQYRRKHGRDPTEARLNADDYPAVVAACDDPQLVVGRTMALVRAGDHRLHISPAPFVSRNSIYIGCQDSQEDHETMPTATATADPTTIRNGPDDGAVPSSRDVSSASDESDIDPVSVPSGANTGVGEPTIVVRPPNPDTIDGDFLVDHRLSDLAARLRRRHHLPTTHTVTVLWKAKGGTSGGKPTLGKCTLASSGLLGWFCETDFVIWLAADHCHAGAFTPPQIEALLYHELLHIDADPETDAPKIRPHDFEGFIGELRRYGAWTADLGTAKAAFAQAKLAL